MSIQNLLQLPPLLAKSRQAAGRSQKAVAMSLGLDPSHFCGLEKGRRRVARQSFLELYCRALGLGARDLGEMRWAFAHDRVLDEVRSGGLPVEAARLISTCLQAIHVLGSDELAGLQDVVDSAVASKRELRELAMRSAQKGEEVPMT
jgi:transcriptional regulator with XRE-family HTH domain